MRLIKKCKDGHYLEGVTVTPQGNRGTTFQDWSGANLLERELRERERITKLSEQFNNNIRKATGDFVPYLAGAMGIAALPAVLPVAASAIETVAPTAMQALNTFFTPSSWMWSSGSKVLPGMAGTLADTGVKAYFLNEGIQGLRDQANKGTLLSNPARTITNTLMSIPAVEVAQGIKRVWGPLAWRNAWFNNLTPASYDLQDSWHPKGKLFGEAPAAISDYLKGNGVVTLPKWKWNFQRKWGPLDADLREEAFKIYLQIPHEERYILNTGRMDSEGNPIYHLNMKEFPEKRVLRYMAENVANNTPTKRGVIIDVANYGGDVNYTKSHKGNKFYVTLDDVFDVNPFLDPNKIARSVPRGIRDLMFKVLDPNEFLYRYKLRTGLNFLKNFEAGTITGGKPFRSITTIKGDLLPDSEYIPTPKTEALIEEAIQKVIDNDITLYYSRGRISSKAEEMQKRLKLSEDLHKLSGLKFLEWLFPGEVKLPMDIYSETKRLNFPKSEWRELKHDPYK